MKAIEKKLKQRITKNIESKIKQYYIKYYTHNENLSQKRVSKNQYKLISESLEIEKIPVKFPCYITTETTRRKSISIDKKKNFITPTLFTLTNKKFAFDVLKTSKSLQTLQNSMLLLYKIISSIENKSETSESLV